MPSLWPAEPRNAPQAVAAPLILTAELPPALLARLNALRSKHYPAGAARAPAHLTLFRHLPGPQLRALIDDVRRLALETRCPLVSVAGLQRPDTSVALKVESPELDEFRERLAVWWSPLLTPGDAAQARLHITLAAHLRPAEARALATTLQGSVGTVRFPVRACLLWQHAEPRWLPLVRLGFHR
jgi:hypothetical protein